MEDFLTKPVLTRIYESFNKFSLDYKFLKYIEILSVYCCHYDLGIALKIQSQNLKIIFLFLFVFLYSAGILKKCLIACGCTYQYIAT